MSIRLKCVLMMILSIKLSDYFNKRIVDSLASFCHMIMVKPMHARMIEARHLPTRVNSNGQDNVQQALNSNLLFGHNATPTP